MWKRHLDPPTPETLTLLAEERAFTPVPDDLRRSALVRARQVPAGPGIFAYRGRVGARILLGAAAGLALLGLAAAALMHHPSDETENALGDPPSGTSAMSVAAPASVTETPPQLDTPAAPTFLPAPSPAPSARMKEVGDGRRPELALVESARRSLSAGDYAATLVQIGEHERRFARGVFVEEREAMRVKALWGLGRLTQARAAVSQFGSRFPRSVLLPSLARLVGPAP